MYGQRDKVNQGQRLTDKGKEQEKFGSEFKRILLMTKKIKNQDSAISRSLKRKLLSTYTEI